MSKRSSIWLHLAISGCSVIACLVASEIALRLYFLGSPLLPVLSSSSALREAHPTLGWSLQPNGTAWTQTLDNTVLVNINSDGQRGMQVPKQRIPGVPRIVLLGDSFIEAYSVPFEKSVAGLLPSITRLPLLEVVNLGVGGYSSVQQWLSLKEFGLAYHPDVVVHFIYPSNDLYENVPLLNNLVYTNDPMKTVGRPFLRREANGEYSLQPFDFQQSHALMERERRLQANRNRNVTFWEKTLIWKFIDRLLSKPSGSGTSLDAYYLNLTLGWPHLASYSKEYAAADTALTEEAYKQSWKEAWEILQFTVRDSKRLTESVGAQYLLVNIPSKFQVEDKTRQTIEASFPTLKTDFNKINRELADFTSREHIPFVDLLPELAAASRTHDVYFGWEDRHLNERGQAIMATQVSTFLLDKALVKSTK